MTGIPLNGKVVDLRQLQTELVAAGVTVGHGLSSDGQTVWLVDTNGVPADFPSGAQTAAVTAVIAAHVPDTSAADDLAAVTTEIASGYQAMMTRLTQIINASNPTNAQVVAAQQDMATIMRRQLRFMKGRLV